MNQSNFAQLLTALTAERDALSNFADLLGHEQNLLIDNQTDQLLELAEKKSASAINLGELGESRRSLLRKNLPELSVETIRIWLEKHSMPCLTIWQEIRALAERAHQLNHTNGELVQMKLRHNQQALSALSKAVNRANLYGPDGQTSFSPGGGRSLGSG